jgi:general stress protein YciG
MDPERVRAIAALGGRAAHAAGTAHRWTTEEAETAGRKGGLARRKLQLVPPPPVDDYSDDDPITQRPITLRAPHVAGAE